MRRGDEQNPKKKILLALTCHDKYLPLLKRCIRSINDNSKFNNVLLLDNCEYELNDPLWQAVTVTGNPGPNKLRNKAIEIAITEGYDWLVYFDADNLMPENFGSLVEVKTNSAESNIGIIFNDAPLQENGKLSHISEFNYVDTCGAWRVDALQQAGGWDESLGGFDDWSIALRVFNLGYKAKNLEIAVKRQKHEDNRGNKASHIANLNKVRSLAVVTLFSGNTKIFTEFKEYTLNENWPKLTHFYWIDNSLSEQFSNKLHRTSQELSRNGYSVTIAKDDAKCVWKHHGDRVRHSHVCGLYNRHLGKVSENLILFHEDDVIPEIGTFDKLARTLYPKSKIAGVGSAYRSRTNPEIVCASADAKVWKGNPKFATTNNQINVGMMGGGFTLYLNFLVKKCLPLKCKLNSCGGLQGWDGNLGSDIFDLGYKLVLDCGNKSQHKAKEVLKYLRKHKLLK